LLKKALASIIVLILILFVAMRLATPQSFIKGLIWISAGMRPTIYSDQKKTEYWHDMLYNQFGELCYVVPTEREDTFLGVVPFASICEIHINDVRLDFVPIYEFAYPEDIMSPQYLPDNKTISFVSHFDNKLKLCIIDDKGQKIESDVVLFDTGYHWLSNDEVMLSYKSKANLPSIAKYNIRTNELNILIENGCYLSYSSNDEYFTYVDITDRNSIMLVDLSNGSSKRIVLPGAYESLGPSRPTNDGEYIVLFVSKMQEDRKKNLGWYSDIWVLCVENNKVQSLKYPHGVIDRIIID
jgi:hypothetical protein